MTTMTTATRILCCLPAALILVLAGCDASEPDVEAGADWGYVYATIESNCSCHISDSPPAGSDLSMVDRDTAYANLVGTASAELPSLNRIEPGDPDNSYLIRKITGTHEDDLEGSGSRMPYGCVGNGCLSDDTITLFREWVTNGASDEIATGDDDDAAGDDDTAGDDDDSADAAWTFTQVAAVTDASCGCHNSANGSGGQSLGTTAQENYDAWVSVPAVNSSTTLNRVEPGDSANSFVMKKIDHEPGSGGGSNMPLGGAQLSQEIRDGIRGWIDAGALNN